VRLPHTLVTTILLAMALLGASAAPARAQIYSWRDANGNLVLSDKPHEGAIERTFEVPRAERVRTTTFVESDRARTYDTIIEDHAERHNVRPALVKAVIQVESAFNPRAVSPKGALGLMQLMPATARLLNVKNAFDPEQNIAGGVAYLRQLLDRYDGNEQLALAAYNAGPGAVDRHNQSVPPYRETRNYVSKISDMAGATSGPRGTRIYRVVEIVDGREIVRYTDRKPDAD